LQRYGQEESGQPIKTDELTYTYTGNQLQTVTDATNNPDGFNDGNTTGADFTYDTFGNITQDKNKGITNVKYNHLNLPVEVVFTTGKINYIYNAAGTRLSKKVQPTGSTLVTTDYVNGFQYENNVLQFFPHTEGYVKPNGTNSYLYVYQYKDHLGNVRLSYADVNKNGTIEPATEILEENNYYPFGLKHKGYNEIANSNRSEAAERYKFNGMEWQPELGLDLYDFGARNYDSSIGRWLNMDPLAENSRRWTPYNYAYNNPIFFVDPDGMQAKKFEEIESVVDINEATLSTGGMENDTVIITGPGAQQATDALNKSSSLNITRDKETGQLSASGTADTDYDKALQSAIDDPNITVNLKTVNTEQVAVDGVVGDIFGGAYGGSSKSSDGKIQTMQFINMNHAKKIEDAGVIKQGNLVGHELNESYIASQHNNGVNRANSDNGNAAYKKGHDGANKVDPTPKSYPLKINGIKYAEFPNITVRLN